MSDHVFTDPTNLPDEVAELSRSLGIRTSDPVHEPDAFVQAIRHNRAKLLEIKQILTEENERQKVKADELNKREATIMKREQRMAAYEELQRMNEALAFCRPRVRGWWYKPRNPWR
jgi:hypothetical protein